MENRYLIEVRKFTLVKETPKAIRIRLENHPKKICIWMPKECTKNFTQTSAQFVKSFFMKNLCKEQERLKIKEEKMKAVFENFNALHVVNRTKKDIKEIEKIIDQKVNELE
jgi:hypothetical protein